MIHENFVLLGALFNIIGSVSYLRDVIRGKAKPNRTTWFLWALAPLAAFAASLGEGVGIRATMTFMVGFGPLLVFIASFINPQAYWKLTRLDYVCGALSLIGLGLWWVTGDGLLAIGLSILADALAGVPTVVKSFKFPETENYHVFVGGTLSAAITLLTIDTWDFAYWGFPVYILSICLLLIVLIKFQIGKKFSKV